MLKGYIPGLDGLRALAIAWVMLAHVSAASQWQAGSGVNKLFELVANSGWVGVQLFFVLSGFLITKILLKDKGQPHQIKNFYIRRSLRIFPVYYVTLLFFFVLLPLLNYSPDWLANEREHQAWYWVYLNNWTRAYVKFKTFPHFWSLAIEEQFYLIWPFVVVFVRQNRLAMICMAMIVSAPIFRYLLFYHFPEVNSQSTVGAAAAYNFTFARWDSIALGGLLAIWSREPNILECLKRWLLPALGVCIGLIGLQVILLGGFPAVAGATGLLTQSTSALLCFFLLLLILDARWQWLTKLLELRPLKLIGKYSYAMYIFHLPLMVVWMSYLKPDLSKVPEWQIPLQVMMHYSAIFIISFILASISWVVLEHPFLKLKKRFEFG